MLLWYLKKGIYNFLLPGLKTYKTADDNTFTLSVIKLWKYEIYSFFQQGTLHSLSYKDNLRTKKVPASWDVSYRRDVPRLQFHLIYCENSRFLKSVFLLFNIKNGI